MFTLIRSMWALVMKRYIQNFKIKKRNQLVLRKNEVLVVNVSSTSKQDWYKLAGICTASVTSRTRETY